MANPKWMRLVWATLLSILCLRLITWRLYTMLPDDNNGTGLYILAILSYLFGIGIACVVIALRLARVIKSREYFLYILLGMFLICGGLMGQYFNMRHHVYGHFFLISTVTSLFGVVILIDGFIFELPAFRAKA